MQAKIGFIGGGHMATAILEGLVEHYPKSLLYVADRNAPKREYFSETLGINTASHFSEFIDEMDAIVLAIKPQGFPELLPELKPHLKEETLVISVAAGISSEAILRALGRETQPLVRTMPNIPAAVGLGATALFSPNTLTDSHAALTETIFNACGITTWVEKEALLSAVISVSGSSPAYFFYLLEIMIDAGVKLGLSRESSEILAKQTMLGSAQIALDSDKSVKALKESVMSPEGTTEQAIFSFERDDLQQIIERGMQAAFDRDQVLSSEISKKL
ncbi:pyrroline-5-carboxylate reductase [Ignatzschineria sp. RMDPL8A]|uniref:pyrroline-5-carboxylate reductase n=1 Tax=Ignatzschineria sp. RMDPL8A TaxID=2999236 RepID=UPI00244670DD|nr:pyrroline-5-carboxylate reductase [Ignatzschineria sp. RMDPL8A]MDG9729603.1 pyrroline-5-carboxylate reductase [Ignatzschineria sp. RMDPL8A]